MNNQTEIESRLRERLNEIREIPARNPQAAARGRARFLAQAAYGREARRPKGWLPIFRTQQFAMNMIVTLLVIAGLLLGGGTTVLAAQDDLPGEPLYAVKTLSEDVSLQFQPSSEAKVDRLMQLAETRIQEITHLVEVGRTPPEQVRLRLEQHVQEALQLCSNLADAEMDQKLVQVRNQLQQQELEMLRLQARAGQAAQPVLEQTRTMLQAQLNVVNDGLANPEAFRKAIHANPHYGQTQIPPAGPAANATPHDSLNGVATTPAGGPGNGNGVGPGTNPGEPHPHVTPTPKNDHPTPVNNGGGNDKDKEKDPKDKDPGKGGSSGNDKDNGSGGQKK